MIRNIIQINQQQFKQCSLKQYYTSKQNSNCKQYKNNQKMDTIKHKDINNGQWMHSLDNLAQKYRQGEQKQLSLISQLSTFGNAGNPGSDIYSYALASPISLYSKEVSQNDDHTHKQCHINGDISNNFVNHGETQLYQNYFRQEQPQRNGNANLKVSQYSEQSLKIASEQLSPDKRLRKCYLQLYSQLCNMNKWIELINEASYQQPLKTLELQKSACYDNYQSKLSQIHEYSNLCRQSMTNILNSVRDVGDVSKLLKAYMENNAQHQSIQVDVQSMKQALQDQKNSIHANLNKSIQPIIMIYQIPIELELQQSQSQSQQEQNKQPIYQQAYYEQQSPQKIENKKIQQQQSQLQLQQLQDLLSDYKKQIEQQKQQQKAQQQSLKTLQQQLNSQQSIISVTIIKQQPSSFQGVVERESRQSETQTQFQQKQPNQSQLGREYIHSQTLANQTNLEDSQSEAQEILADVCVYRDVYQIPVLLQPFQYENTLDYQHTSVKNNMINKSSKFLLQGNVFNYCFNQNIDMIKQEQRQQQQPREVQQEQQIISCSEQRQLELTKQVINLYQVPIQYQLLPETVEIGVNTLDDLLLHQMSFPTNHANQQSQQNHNLECVGLINSQNQLTQLKFDHRQQYLTKVQLVQSGIQTQMDDVNQNQSVFIGRKNEKQQNNEKQQLRAQYIQQPHKQQNKKSLQIITSTINMVVNSNTMIQHNNVHLSLPFCTEDNKQELAQASLPIDLKPTEVQQQKIIDYVSKQSELLLQNQQMKQQIENIKRQLYGAPKFDNQLQRQVQSKFPNHTGHGNYQEGILQIFQGQDTQNAQSEENIQSRISFGRQPSSFSNRFSNPNLNQVSPKKEQLQNLKHYPHGNPYKESSPPNPPKIKIEIESGNFINKNHYNQQYERDHHQGQSPKFRQPNQQQRPRFTLSGPIMQRQQYEQQPYQVFLQEPESSPPHQSQHKQSQKEQKEQKGSQQKQLSNKSNSQYLNTLIKNLKSAHNQVFIIDGYGEVSSEGSGSAGRSYRIKDEVIEEESEARSLNHGPKQQNSKREPFYVDQYHQNGRKNFVKSQNASYDKIYYNEKQDKFSQHNVQNIALGNLKFMQIYPKKERIKDPSTPNSKLTTGQKIPYLNQQTPSPSQYLALKEESQSLEQQNHGLQQKLAQTQLKLQIFRKQLLTQQQNMYQIQTKYKEKLVGIVEQIGGYDEKMAILEVELSNRKAEYDAVVAQNQDQTNSIQKYKTLVKQKQQQLQKAIQQLSQVEESYQSLTKKSFKQLTQKQILQQQLVSQHNQLKNKYEQQTAMFKGIIKQKESVIQRLDKELQQANQNIQLMKTQTESIATKLDSVWAERQKYREIVEQARKGTINESLSQYNGVQSNQHADSLKKIYDKQLESQQSSFNSKLQQKSVQITQLQQTLTVTISQLQSLHEKINKKQKQNSQLQKQICNLQSEIKDLKKIQISREVQLELQYLREELVEANKDIQEKDQKIRELQSCLSMLQKEVAILEDCLQNKLSNKAIEQKQEIRQFSSDRPIHKTPSPKPKNLSRQLSKLQQEFMHQRKKIKRRESIENCLQINENLIQHLNLKDKNKQIKKETQNYDKSRESSLMNQQYLQSNTYVEINNKLNKLQKERQKIKTQLQIQINKKLPIRDKPQDKQMNKKINNFAVNLHTVTSIFTNNSQLKSIQCANSCNHKVQITNLQSTIKSLNTQIESLRSQMELLKIQQFQTNSHISSLQQYLITYQHMLLSTQPIIQQLQSKLLQYLQDAIQNQLQNEALWKDINCYEKQLNELLREKITIQVENKRMKKMIAKSQRKISSIGARLCHAAKDRMRSKEAQALRYEAKCQGKYQKKYQINVMNQNSTLKLRDLRIQ